MYVAGICFPSCAAYTQAQPICICSAFQGIFLQMYSDQRITLATPLLSPHFLQTLLNPIFVVLLIRFWYSGSTYSVPDIFMYNLWWTEWQWTRLLSKVLRFSTEFYHCSVLNRQCTQRCLMTITRQDIITVLVFKFAALSPTQSLGR
jgi:hypothetical protein